MAGFPTTSGAPPGPADDKVGLVLGGKYRVMRKLGEGGMGSVYEGMHELIGKRVAIKTLNPEFTKNPAVVERFRREARAATAAGNEHIIDVTDLGDLPDGSPFLVMEYLDGRDFAHLLESDGALPVGRAVRIVRQVCDALAAAHSKGIVHRDLKPENIYLVQRKGETDFVKVLDFGISKMREATEGVSKSLTQTGTAMGTPHYMSPEQAQGLAITDHRTDIYALGVILYYAITGYTPFDSETYVGLVVQIMQDEPRKLSAYRSDVPAELEAVVLRCLAKKPEQRPATVDELAAALAPFEGLNRKATLVEFAGTLPPGAPDPADTQRVEIDGPALPPKTNIGPHTDPKAKPAVAPYTGSNPESAMASGESVAGLPTANRKPILLAGVVLGVLAIAIIGIALTTSGGESGSAGAASTNAATPQTTPTPAPAPAAAPAPVEPAAAPTTAAPQAEVQVRIVVTPADAKVFLGELEFSSPVNAPRPRSLDPIKLRIEREGFEPYERSLVLDSNQSLEIALQKLFPKRNRAGKDDLKPLEGEPSGPIRDKIKKRFRDEF